MYLAFSVLITLFQCKFAVSRSAIQTEALPSKMSKFLPAVIRIQWGSSFCGQKLMTRLEYVKNLFAVKAWHILSCVMTKLYSLLVGLSCCTPVSYPQSPSKRSLPYLGHCQIVHQLLRFFTSYRVDHWAGKMFKVMGRGFVIFGSNFREVCIVLIDTCSWMARTFIVCCVTIICCVPLGIAVYVVGRGKGASCLRWERRSLRWGGVGPLSLMTVGGGHMPWSVVDCDPLVQSWCDLQHLLCHWVPRLHDRWGIGEARNGDYGWCVDHLLFFRTCIALPHLCHPLFFFARWWGQNLVDTIAD